MPGHVFIIQGDITKLYCDALAVPCSRNSIKSKPFTKPGWTPDDHGWKTERMSPEDNIRRVTNVDNTEPQPWLVASVGGKDPAFYANRATKFLQAACSRLPENALNKRSRPLIALPIFGTGLGGAEASAGDVLEKLLPALYDFVSSAPREVDVVLAAGTEPDHDAAQAQRRVCDRDQRYASRVWSELKIDVGDDDRIAQLMEEMKMGRVALFIGAGVSQGAGAPSWDGLLDRLLTKAVEKDSRLKCLDPEEGDARDRASIIRHALGDETMRAEIIEILKSCKRFAISHALLAGLPVKEVVTTNYDKLFEEACKRARSSGKPLEFIKGIETLPASSDALEIKWLLKLHGCIDRPQDIVLTRDDYLGYAADRDALTGVLQGLMLTRHMLFVGFSLKDENFHRVAWEVRRALDRIGGRGSSRLARGTVLSPIVEKATELIWDKQMSCVSFGDNLSVGCRQQEIFLDYLQAQTHGHSHYMNDRFQKCLNAQERELKAEILRFLRNREKFLSIPVYKEIETAFEKLGWRKGSGE